MAVVAIVFMVIVLTDGYSWCLVLLLLLLVANDVIVVEQVLLLWQVVAYDGIGSAGGGVVTMWFQWQCFWCCCF